MKKSYISPQLTVCATTPCNLLAGTTTSPAGPTDEGWSPDNLPDGWGILEVKPDQKGTPD